MFVFWVSGSQSRGGVSFEGLFCVEKSRKKKIHGLCGGFWAISGSSEITEGTQIIGTAAARIVNAASWIVHSTTSTCLRTEHTAEHINASLI